jgi:hypothetical protein
MMNRSVGIAQIVHSISLYELLLLAFTSELFVSMIIVLAIPDAIATQIRGELAFKKGS